MKYLVVFLFLINFHVTAETLSEEEKFYFNLLDFNNDGNISFQEADQILKLIFQLLDEDKDKIITEREILNLKNIIESFS